VWPGVRETVTFGLGQQLLYEMHIDIQLSFRISEFITGGHLRDMLENLRQEILSEGCSLISNGIIQANDELDDQLDHIIVDSRSQQVLAQLQQEGDADAFKGRLEDVDKSGTNLFVALAIRLDGVIVSATRRCVGGDCIGNRSLAGQERPNGHKDHLAFFEHTDVAHTDVDVQ
jgi:hypothetical protein